ncbi:MAG: alpha/beta hydrolase fold domain-containing protein [Promethearchaeota archaeon]
MHLKENRNWLVWLFFLGALIDILYILNTFGWYGLISWEIAIFFLPLCVIGIIWTSRRIIGVKKGRINKYKHSLVVFSLIIFIVFSIFSIIPFLYVPLLGDQFEEKFKEKFGENYWEKIPEKYRKYLKTQGNYFDNRDLKYFFNRDIDIEKNVAYGDENEYQIMDIYEDKSIEEKNKPALILVHGGGSTTFVKKDSSYYKWTCRYFASLGFVAFSIEYTPAPIKPFPQAVKDVRTAIVHIKKNAEKYNIDNNSVVLMGGSRGGHLVTISAYTGVNDADEGSWWRQNGGNFTAEELRVACVIDLYGAVDQFYSFEHNGFLKSRNEIIFGGSPVEKKELYEKHTCKNYVSKECPPTLIMHGSIDGMVQVGESQGLAKALNNEGGFYIYLEIPFGQHGFDVIPGTAGNSLAYYFIPRFIFLILYA